jgi:CubicO group peptidase (beta-lactamase class C family)
MSLAVILKNHTMKSKLLIGFFLALSWSIGFNLQSQNIVGDNNLTQTQINLVSKYISTFPSGTQLSIALLRDKRVSFVGIIKEQDSLLSVDNKDSVFEIGSITKLFTSTLLSNLVCRHQMNLNEPIANVMPYKLNQTEKNINLITFKMLATHTSGLPYMPDNYAEGYDTTMIREYLQKVKLHSTPGENFEYSNIGAGLLGNLLEIKTGKTYEELLKEKIFSKYNMNSSTTVIANVNKMIVKGRDSSGRIIENSHPNVLRASGGILSNAIDLSKYICANFYNDSVLSFQRQPTDDMELSLGWMPYKFGQNFCMWYWHDGRMDGYRASVYMDANTKCAVIVLSNVSNHHKDNDNIDKLCLELLKQEYIAETRNKRAFCEAPFLEVALLKGWGTSYNDSIRLYTQSDTSIIGVWQKQVAGRTITRTFMSNNKVQSDFFIDPEIDVWGYYELKGRQITFRDVGGEACNSLGTYEYNIQGNKLSFKIINDPYCDGRRNGLSGIWTRKK